MTKKKRSASLQEEPEDEEDYSSHDEDMSEQEEEVPENDGEIPFLDTFYGLASASPDERAQAAHAMLQHCLLGPSANSKDAAYCFKRLLNGLCSGRAAARQGYASALCSFLKIAHSTGALKEIQKEANNDKDEALLLFVRNELLKTTDPKQVESKKFGKAKGSEERDYQFGRLFGILSVVRSGILAPSDDNLAQVKQVSAGLVNDLIELYHHKKWMREPTSHGIITLLNSLYQASKISEDPKIVLNHLVQESIVPKLFAGKAIADFSAEQIAVAVSIQAHIDLFEASSLPAPLNEAILSAETIPIFSDALCATSTVVHPRSHIVWDMLWQFLTTESPKENGKIRTLCESCPVSDEPAAQIVKALIQSVVTESLLAIGTDGEGTNPTHERRALALSIVRAACGGQLNSSTAGPFVIATDAKLLENAILTPDIVKRLFLDIICAAGGSSKSAHMLKPLALYVLETIVESDALSDVSSAESLDRRLSLAKTLLANDTRFDGRTKTSAVSSLLLLDDSVEITYCKELGDMWTNYIDFVAERILSTSLDTNENNDDMQDDEEALRLSSHEALGYADLLFNAAKRILRLQVAIDDEERADFEKFRSSTVQRILGFLMASAFFDCSNLSGPDNKPKKKKGKKKSLGASSTHSAVEEGLRIKRYVANHGRSSSTFPYSIRTTMSSRFFSLLADCTAMATSTKPTSDEKQGKDSRVLEALSDVTEGWTLLEELGARSLAAEAEVNEDDGDEVQSVSTAINAVKKMQQNALALGNQNVVQDDKEAARAKCTVGCTILVSTLCLQFLRCGTSDEITDEIDEDDGDDDEDVIEMITDLQDIPRNLLESSPGESGDEEESVGLLGLAELCVHVLSAPFGSSGLTRGASPKLLREAVKFAWIGGLSAFAAIAGGEATLDDEVFSVLLTAIGVSASAVQESENSDEQESEGEDDSDSDGGEEDKAVFSQAAGQALGLDDDESDVEMEEANNGSASDEEDVQLDPSQLESLLLEDSDAILDDEDGIEVDELEHHAGADAALAKLIKLKQDTRKAGRQALERLEASKQLRCIALVDTLLSNPGRQWTNLLQAELFVKMVVPLLQTRRDLEKALEKSSTSQLGKKSSGGADSEKRALVERLTSLLKTKLCKVRWSKEIQADSKKVMEVATEIMNQARRAISAEQASCCSSSLLALVKTVADTEDLIDASSVYSEAVAEWSTKRTTKLQTSLFDDLIQQLPSLAQVVLVAPLSTAAKEARSPFLKSESFRLLGTLFSRSGDQDEMEAKGQASLKANSSGVISSINDALQDDDMLKTKRAKDVLKSASKIVAYQRTSSNASVSKDLVEMKSLAEQVKENSESSGVVAASEKLVTEIDECRKDLKQDSGDKEKGSESSKKKKKKSKSKKKK